MGECPERRVRTARLETKMSSTRIHTAEIEVFYFGPPGQSILGTYHFPGPQMTREVAVVLVPPWGEEYYRSHRAYRHLAALLAGAGFPTLRFDFFGCGDSEGEGEHARLHQWIADISRAIKTVRKKCGLAKICLIGYRLGATLATRAPTFRSGTGLKRSVRGT